ncbi:MAG: hypothetical protein ACI8Z5_000794 [Lentimonas sp.]|jgi:hypothetical protein
MTLGEDSKDFYLLKKRPDLAYLKNDLCFQTVEVEFQNNFKNCRSVVYLDLISLVELVGVDYLDAGQVSRGEFSNYQTVDGIQIPRTSVYHKDDVLVQQVDLTKVTVNYGILTELFKTPAL